MQQTWQEVCQGKPASSSKVGTKKDEFGKAYFDGVASVVPEELRANNPGHFRYAVCLKEERNFIETCTYIGTSEFIFREQIRWRVTVRGTHTAEIVNERLFYGSAPDKCPSTIKSGEGGTRAGSSPGYSEVTKWLEGVLR